MCVITVVHAVYVVIESTEAHFEQARGDSGWLMRDLCLTGIWRRQIRQALGRSTTSEIISARQICVYSDRKVRKMSVLGRKEIFLAQRNHILVLVGFILHFCGMGVSVAPAHVSACVVLQLISLLQHVIGGEVP